MTAKNTPGGWIDYCKKVQAAMSVKRSLTEAEYHTMLCEYYIKGISWEKAVQEMGLDASASL